MTLDELTIDRVSVDSLLVVISDLQASLKKEQETVRSQQDTIKCQQETIKEMQEMIKTNNESKRELLMLTQYIYLIYPSLVSNRDF